MTPSAKPAEFQELATSMRGTLLLGGEAGYEQVTAASWPGQSWSRKPAAIAQCRNATDVSSAVRFALRNSLEITVRGGGHNSAGLSIADGALMIDLSQMRAVIVYPDERRVVAQGGCRLGDVDHETQAFGLATPIGVNSNTGLAGLVLGGGIGWIQGKYGLSIDNALGYQLVTAEGEILWVTGESHPDLFWALRGGGGNFGVVTAFELALHPVGPTVYGGPIFFGPERIQEVARWFRDWIEEVPDELTVLADVLTAPAVPFLPSELHGQPIIGIFANYTGPLEEAEKAVATLKAIPDPVVDMMGPIPFTALQSFVDGLYPNGGRYLMRSKFLTGLPNEAIDEFIAVRSEAPVEVAEIHVHHMGGATRNVADGDTAWPNRTAPVLLAVFAGWKDPADDQRAEAWADEAIDRLTPWHAPGAYTNYMGPEESPDRVREAYGQTWGRLLEVKRQWDPSNVFHVNQNIWSTE